MGEASGLIGSEGCDLAVVTTDGRGYWILLRPSQDDPAAVAPYDPGLVRGGPCHGAAPSRGRRRLIQTDAGGLDGRPSSRPERVEQSPPTNLNCSASQIAPTCRDLYAWAAGPAAPTSPTRGRLAHDHVPQAVRLVVRCTGHTRPRHGLQLRTAPVPPIVADLDYQGHSGDFGGSQSPCGGDREPCHRWSDRDHGPAAPSLKPSSSRMAL